MKLPVYLGAFLFRRKGGRFFGQEKKEPDN